MLRRGGEAERARRARGRRGCRRARTIKSRARMARPRGAGHQTRSSGRAAGWTSTIASGLGRGGEAKRSRRARGRRRQRAWARPGDKKTAPSRSPALWYDHLRGRHLLLRWCQQAANRLQQRPACNGGGEWEATAWQATLRRVDLERAHRVRGRKHVVVLAHHDARRCTPSLCRHAHRGCAQSASGEARTRQGQSAAGSAVRRCVAGATATSGRSVREGPRVAAWRHPA